MDRIAQIGNAVMHLMNNMYVKGREDGITEEAEKCKKKEEAIFDRGYDAGFDEGYKTAIGEAYTPDL